MCTYKLFTPLGQLVSGLHVLAQTVTLCPVSLANIFVPKLRQVWSS